jgi:RNA polymerase sigma-70 factor (ECF subfamily)
LAAEASCPQVVQCRKIREYFFMSASDDDRPAQDASRDDRRSAVVYDEFMTLLMEHQSGLRGYIRSLVPAWSDVDDVIQQTSLIAWRKFGEFERGTNFLAWLMVIARFESLKHRRSLARGPRVMAEELCELLASEADAAAFESPEINRRRAALEHCLGKMDAGRRRLLLEAHAPGVRIKELASRAGRSDQAVYKVIQRLRAAVADCMRTRLAHEGGA